MKINLDDTGISAKLYPFAVIRHVADIRIGILTIREKWAFAGYDISLNDHLNEDKTGILSIPANIIPATRWMKALTPQSKLPGMDEVKVLEYPWQIFQYNDWAIRQDFELVTSGRESGSVSNTNRSVSPENIFLEPGTIVEHCILNASAGPIYIGKNAQIMEGCMLRGPVALCEGAVLKMGSKVYGATTIGPYCVAAGEIKNSVMFGYSNKAHDGYLGDSVIAEWCNLGAGTTNSNVKNTAGQVKVWCNHEQDYVTVGQKCGLLMGDYSRAAINTSFNTGTVVGISCNIFAEGFPPTKVYDFTWGQEKYIFEKVLVDIDNWKKLKGHHLTQSETEILKQLYIQ